MAPLIQQWQYRIGWENVGLFFRQEMPLKSHPLIKTIFTLEKNILFEKEISFYQLQKSAPVNRTQLNFGESRTCIKIARLVVLETNKRVKMAVAWHIGDLPEDIGANIYLIRRL